MNVRINYRLTALAILFSTSSLMGEDNTKPAAAPAAITTEVTPFLVPSLEEKFASEANKADAITTKAEAEATKLKKVAAEARLKGYKDKLAEITKTGDFDKAQQVKARITQLENDPEAAPEKPSKRPRPKDTVKFGGHTYALIKEPATWHVAKLQCEEMGGHLAVLDSEREADWVSRLIADGKQPTWVGATDEELEGKWFWVTGEPLQSFILNRVKFDNGGEEGQHFLCFNQTFWDDAGSSRRAYVCEWNR